MMIRKGGYAGFMVARNEKAFILLSHQFRCSCNSTIDTVDGLRDYNAELIATLNSRLNQEKNNR